MNERIKKMMEDSRPQSPSEFSSMAEVQKYAEDWTEKFAELIITETHEVIVVGGVDDLDGVLKHFEIE
jgi:hypothetical protein